MAESNGFSMNQFKSENPDLNAEDPSLWIDDILSLDKEEKTEAPSQENADEPSQGASSANDEPSGEDAKEEEVDPDEERRRNDSAQGEEEGEGNSALVDEESSEAESETPEEEDLIGEHADLFVWDDEEQAYLPKDEESARAIAALGDNLDIQRFDPDTGTHTQMEYSLLNREMVQRRLPRPENPGDEEGEEDKLDTASERADQASGRTQGQQGGDMHKDGIEQLVESSVLGACFAIKTVASGLWSLGEAAANKFASVTEDWKRRSQEEVAESPKTQAEDLTSAVQAASLNDEDEVSVTDTQTANVSEKLKATAAKSQAWVDDHMSELRSGVLDPLNSLSNTLDLDSAEVRPSTTEELEQYIAELPAEKKEQVETFRSKIKSTLDQAKSSADEWINGGGPASLAALHEDDPQLASKARSKLQREYERFSEEGEDQNGDLWKMLSVDGKKDQPLGEMVQNFGSSIKRMFQNAFSNLAFRASVAEQKSQNGPSLG